MSIGRYARLLGALLALAWGTAQGQVPGSPGPVPGFEQHLGLRLPLESTFQDESGHAQPLKAYLRHRPALFVMAYYSCSDLCDVVFSSTVQDLRKAQLQAGRDLEVVVISFNPHDTPAIAQAKKETLFDTASPDARGWHFLTGDRAAIAAITQAVGFRYRYDPQTRQYAHPAGLALVTPEGTISRYFLGVSYPPEDLRAGLAAAAKGEVGGLTHQLLVLCFHYDPSTGRYTPLITGWVRLIACGITLLVAGYALRQVRRERARTRELMP